MIIHSLKRYWRNIVSFIFKNDVYECAKPKNLNNKSIENVSTYTNKPLRKDLLDNLDAYFKYIKQMRKHDHSSYDFFKNLGGQLIVGDDTALTLDGWHSLPVRWKQLKPTFGCVFIEDVKTTYRETAILRFVYFRKHTNKIANVQPVSVDGDIYIVNATYSFLSKNGQTEQDFFISFPVLITNDNQCKILLMKHNDDLIINSKKGHKGSYRICRTKWSFPEWAIYEAKKANKTPEQIMLGAFYFAANCYEIAQHQMIDVRATKGNVTARFTIKGDVTAGLFKDREVTGNRKKKIFHSVKPHIRNNKSLIKMHFRGERKFTWNGYSIAITVPGKDYKSFMPEISLSAIDYDENQPIPENMVDVQNLSKTLVDITTRVVA